MLQLSSLPSPHQRRSYEMLHRFNEGEQVCFVVIDDGEHATLPTDALFEMAWAAHSRARDFNRTANAIGISARARIIVRARKKP